MMRNRRFAILLAVFLLVGANIFGAGDYQWKKKCYTWTGNGKMRTEKVPVFGSHFRVRYSSPQQGPLQVTLVDESTKEKEPAKRFHKVANSRRLSGAFSKEFSGMKEVSLLIEGDARGWVVEIDQWLDSVEEWRLRGFLTKMKNRKLRKTSAWIGKGPLEFDYAPRHLPCCLRMKLQEDGVVAITIRNEADEVLFSSLLSDTKSEATGWLHETGPFKVSVTGDDVPWSLNGWGE